MNQKTSSKQDWSDLYQSFWGSNDSPESVDHIDLQHWAKQLDGWWQTHSASQSESINALYERLHNSNQFFGNFAEPFLKSQNDSNRDTDPAKILSSYLEHYLDALTTDDASAVKGFWVLPVILWKQQLDFLGGSWPKDVEKLEEYFQLFRKDTKLVNAYNQYLESLKQYQTAFVSMSLGAANKLMQLLEETAAKPPNIEHIIASWVAIFECEYAIFSHSDAYAKLYGNLINTWMHLIQLNQQFFRPWCDAFGAYDDDRVEQLKAKQKELEEENQALKEQLSTFKGAHC